MPLEAGGLMLHAAKQDTQLLADSRKCLLGEGVTKYWLHLKWNFVRDFFVASKELRVHALHTHHRSSKPAKLSKMKVATSCKRCRRRSIRLKVYLRTPRRVVFHCWDRRTKRPIGNCVSKEVSNAFQANHPIRFADAYQYWSIHNSSDLRA